MPEGTATTMPQPPGPPRTWLYVPAHDRRKIAKSRTCGSDAVILDLEDAVPPPAKREAREVVRDEIAAGGFDATQCWVRINAPVNGDAWREDIAALAGAAPYGIVIPKVCHPDHIRDVRRFAAEVFGGDAAPRLVPIVTEQATGVLQLAHTLTADLDLYAAFWGSEDLAASIGATRVRTPDGDLLDVLAVARSMFLLAAASAGVAPVDTPYLRIDDIDGLRQEAEQARWRGFVGKQVIHPSHVPVVNEALTPTPVEVEQATAMVAAAEAVGGGGALRVGDQMIDEPHLRSARRILARAAQVNGSGEVSRGD